MLDLGRTLLQSPVRTPRDLAIVDGTTRFTYAEWAPRIASVAAGLTVLDLRRGDHLLVALQNRWEMATVHWACQFAGIIVTPLNWRAKPDELDYCAIDADAKAIVFEAASAQAVAASVACQRLPRIALVGAEEGTHQFDALLRTTAPDTPTPVANAGARPWMLWIP